MEVMEVVEVVEKVEVHDKWLLTSNYPHYPLTTRG